MSRGRRPLEETFVWEAACKVYDQMMDEVSREENIPAADIQSDLRHAELVTARWKLWSRLRQRGFSLVMIARLSGKDHVTIMHRLRAGPSKAKIASRLDKIAEAIERDRAEEERAIRSARRVEEAVRLYSQHHSLGVVGAHMGLTRERVRQLLQKVGIKPLDVREQKRQALIEQLRAGQVPTIDAPKSIVKAALRVVDAEKRAEAKEAEKVNIVRLVERVRQGESIRKVSQCDPTIASLISRECAKVGVTSRHGRWSDFQARIDYISKRRGEGATWGELAIELSEIEGKPLAQRTIYQFASKYVDGKYMSRQKTMKTFKPVDRAPKIKLQQPSCIDPGDRKTQELISGVMSRYGLKTARETGFEFGLSRNSVCSIWRRYRGRIAA